MMKHSKERLKEEKTHDYSTKDGVNTVVQL